MKRLMPAVLIGMCVLLLACSKEALDSAAEALSLWWTRVLPALFPFYVLTSLMNRFGLLNSLQKRLRSPFLPCFLLGAVAGYPTGARICRMLGREDYAVCCNLCSPMFLLGVVAVGTCGNAGMFWPLAIAHYGSALILFALHGLFGGRPAPDAPAPAPPLPVPEGGMMADITAGMQAMLSIGGCIVFFYVPVNTLLTVALHGRLPMLSTTFIGIAELTSGCRHAAELGLPINVLSGFLAFFVTFGGLCVFAQAMLVAGLERPGEYLLGKVAQGCLAAILAYLLTPLFVDTSVTALSNTAQPYAQNALIGLTFLVSACVGLVGCYLLALVVRRPAHTKSPRSIRAGDA